MIPGSANALLLATAADGYAIERSVRLNAPDSAYLSRTPASAGNRKTWTWAGWVKRSELGRVQNIFRVVGSLSDTTIFQIRFMSNDAIGVVNYSYFPLISTPVYRDASAWYHVLVVLDTTQATASNRLRFYINGTEVTTWATDNRASLTQNSDQGVNQASVSHQIGGQGASEYFSGYLADIHFIDGQALDPTSFGEFDDNGIWQPIEYSGTYGTNGFHLPFSDNSTAAALGTDTSGNSNTWTVNNLSVTAGAGNDSLVDVPTNGTETDTGVGGEVRGNYCTLNPLDTSGFTLSNGNLDWSHTAGGWTLSRSTIGITSGKWYAEMVRLTGAYSHFGISKSTASLANYLGSDANGWAYGQDGNKYTGGSGSAYGASFSNNDVIGIAFDADNGTLVFYKNGVSQGTAYTGLTSGPYFFSFSSYSTSQTGVCNFGQRPFAYTAPSGFKALNTANLPAPVVTKPSTVMDVKLYTGTGANQTITGLGFSPDLVWIKGRSLAAGHILNNTVAGAGTAKSLYSNTTDSQGTYDQYGYLSAFTSDGFTTQGGTDPTDPYNLVGKASQTYVAWTWDAGSSTVTNTQGSISSQVRANASAGFSIVTYTGNGTAGATIGHGLGVAPEMIIIKNRDQADAWQVYHAANTANPETDYLVLNTTAATADNVNRWNDTAPGALVFTLGNGAEVNTNTEDYVAYCFTGLDGYSSFGSYTGNGSADGPFVYTGFRPKWILIKQTNSTNNWRIFDTERLGYNANNYALYPSVANAEGTEFLGDILSNGFKVRNTVTGTNGSGDTYIYAAFAESPLALNNRAR